MMNSLMVAQKEAFDAVMAYAENAATSDKIRIINEHVNFVNRELYFSFVDCDRGSKEEAYRYGVATGMLWVLDSMSAEVGGWIERSIMEDENIDERVRRVKFVDGVEGVEDDDQ